MTEAKYIIIRMPGDVVEGARILEEEFEKVARVGLAIALYARGVLSLGQARRLAGLTKWEFLEELEDDVRFARE